MKTTFNKELNKAILVGLILTTSLTSLQADMCSMHYNKLMDRVSKINIISTLNVPSQIIELSNDLKYYSGKVLINCKVSSKEFKDAKAVSEILTKPLKGK